MIPLAYPDVKVSDTVLGVLGAWLVRRGLTAALFQLLR